MATLEELRRTIWNITDFAGVEEWFSGIRGLSTLKLFPGFPDEVQKGLAAYDMATPIVPLPSGVFKKVANAALQEAIKAVRRYKLAEHSGRHFMEVDANGTPMLTAHCQSLGYSPTETQLIIQPARVGFLKHDDPHSGSTLLRDSPFKADRQFRHPLGDRVPLEWLAALKLVTFCLKHGFTWPQIALAVSLPLESVFGGEEVDYIPVVKPKTVSTGIMRLSDTLPPKDFFKAIARAICVNGIEIPANPDKRLDLTSPDAFDVLLESQEGFWGKYVLGLVEKVNALAGFNLVARAGFDGRVEGHLERIAVIRAGKAPGDARAIREMIADPRLAVKLRNSAKA